MRHCSVCQAEINELNCHIVGWIPKAVFCSVECLERGTGRSSSDPHFSDGYLNGEGEIVPWEDR